MTVPNKKPSWVRFLPYVQSFKGWIALGVTAYVIYVAVGGTAQRAGLTYGHGLLTAVALALLWRWAARNE